MLPILFLASQTKSSSCRASNVTCLCYQTTSGGIACLGVQTSTGFFPDTYIVDTLSSAGLIAQESTLPVVQFSWLKAHAAQLSYLWSMEHITQVKSDHVPRLQHITVP